MAGYTQEQLDHYLTHPEEVDATNTDLVEALARASIAGFGDTEADKTKDGEDAKPSEADEDAKEAARAIEEATAKVAAEKAAEEEAAAKEGKGPGKKVGEEESTRILTPDGKNTIPHSVLKGERTARAAAEAALAESEQTVVALAQQLKTMKSGRPDPGASPTNKTVEEMRALLPEIEKEAPWQVPVLEKFIEAMELAQTQIAELRGARYQDDQSVVATLQEQAQEALANNSTLVLWKAEAPQLFDEAVKFDMALRADPEMREEYATFESRFEAVVELVKARHRGQEIPLPQPVADAGEKPDKGEPPAKPAAQVKQPSASDIQARAKEALAKASAEAVRTLSDIQGGVGEVSAEEALERMDPEQIAAKFAKMDAQQLLGWVMSH